MKATVILVHGAYAESSSWDGVVGGLLAEAHQVIAFATPLRGVATDAALLSSLVNSIDGPVVLAGHSYGGAVLTNVDAPAGHVVAAVYIAGFALGAGEGCVGASALVPGSTLADTLLTVQLADANADTYIVQEVPRPVRRGSSRRAGRSDGGRSATRHGRGAGRAFRGQSAVAFGAQLVPVRGTGPQHSGRRPSPHGRACRARRSLEIAGASHVVGISHPRETRQIILEAAHTRNLADA